MYAGLAFWGAECMLMQVSPSGGQNPCICSSSRPAGWDLPGMFFETHPLIFGVDAGVILCILEGPKW